jgi:peptidyl-prolyl cis-trans isomerase SurA
MKTCLARVVATIVLLSAVPASAAVVNRILATIDGEPITLHELNQFADRAARQQPGTGSNAVLEVLITEKLLQKEVSDKGIVVRDEDVDQYVEGIKQNNNLDDQRLAEALRAQGMTLESYRKQVREEIQKAQLINREIRGKVNVTPEEVERYYQAHLGEYATPESMHLRHILLLLLADADEAEVDSVMAAARELLRQLREGADFAELARQHSQDAAAKDGGDLGWLKRGEMLDAIEEAAMKLKPGEVSEPVRSPAGVHLIRLEERADPSHKSLDELAAGIKERLYDAALEERYQKWLNEELRKRHVVEVLP